MRRESDNARLVRCAMAAVSRYDFDAVEAMVTEDVVVEQPFAAVGMPERMEGRKDFMHGLRLVPTMFKTFKLTISDVYDCPDDDVVVFEQTSHGVFTADDSEYRNRYLMIFGFGDGRINLWKEYYDSRVMNEGMGPIMKMMGAWSTD